MALFSWLYGYVGIIQQKINNLKTWNKATLLEQLTNLGVAQSKPNICIFLLHEKPKLGKASQTKNDLFWNSPIGITVEMHCIIKVRYLVQYCIFAVVWNLIIISWDCLPNMNWPPYIVEIILWIKNFQKCLNYFVTDFYGFLWFS